MVFFREAGAGLTAGVGSATGVLAADRAAPVDAALPVDCVESCSAAFFSPVVFAIAIPSLQDLGGSAEFNYSRHARKKTKTNR